tara:strand:- start:922 stop:1581 length:660 start_codon:yes stop_codon:yes gene_type:complete
MNKVFSGPIDLIHEKNESHSFILNDKEYEKYFDLIKEFVKVDVERKVAFRIKSLKVLSLKDYLKQNRPITYNEALSLFLDVGEQLIFLQNMGKGYVNLNLNDIFLIQSDDDNISFLFLKVDPFFSVKDDVLEIDKTFQKNGFISPQIKNINQIPTNISYSQTIFYELSAIVCNCFGSISNEATFIEYKNHLDCILETKLYWALLRCLEDKPEDRYYLYI